MNKQDRESLVELGTKLLLQVLEERNIDPESMQVMDVTDYYEDNDTVEITHRFKAVRMKNI